MIFDADTLFVPTEPTVSAASDYSRECSRRLQVLAACSGDESLQKFELDRCRQDPWYFMCAYLWVLRPDLVDELGHAELPYLGWPVHHEIVKRILGLDGYRTPLGKIRDVIIKKSRDTGISVCCLGAITHGFVFGKNETSYVISLREAAVDSGKPDSFNDNLFGKIRFFIEHLPSWMRPSPWAPDAEKKAQRGRPRKPRLWDSMCHLTNPDNGCSVVGSSTTPNATRSARARHVLIDEADSIPFLSDLMASACKVGPQILVSSVTDATTPFARVWQGETGLKFDPTPTAQGWLQMTVRYTDRPDWDPSTELGRARIAEMKSSMDDDKWNTEMEGEFRRVAAGSVWGPYLYDEMFLKSASEDQQYIKAATRHGYRSVEGWDFGSGNALSAWVSAWVVPNGNEDIIFVNDFMLWDDAATVESIVSDLGTRGAGPRSRPDISVGDGSGGSQNGRRTMNGIELQTVKSWLSNLADAGIEIHPLTVKNAVKLRDKVRDRIKANRLVFSSKCSEKVKSSWPSLAEAVKRYRIDVRGTPESATKQSYSVRKDINSHPCDALQYIVWAVDQLQL